jgi:hypothetical protein
MQAKLAVLQQYIIHSMQAKLAVLQQYIIHSQCWLHTLRSIVAESTDVVARDTACTCVFLRPFAQGFSVP